VDGSRAPGGEGYLGWLLLCHWEVSAINERRAGPLLKSSDWSASSQRRTLDHSAQATSLLRIEGMTKCSRKARGFGCGSSSEFVAEANPKAAFGWRASVPPSRFETDSHAGFPGGRFTR
jgi:hypothetical protein